MVLRRCIVVLISVIVLGNLGIGNIIADDPGGPYVIAGRVYTADGNNPGEGYDGAYAAVIIEHKGVKTTYADPNGIERDENGTYWYVVTIPEGGWDVGDTFWIWVDGTDWGDENFTCVDHDDTGVNQWTIERTESEPLDINLGDYNFKPIIAWIFALILAIVGIIFGLLRPIRIPFSGRPRQPSDLVEGIVITGEAVIPEELPAEEVPAPAAEAPGAPGAPGEVHVCDTCGGNFEYVPDYENWYCFTCKKYLNETEAPPPPEPSEEPPAPPEEELPPPSDEPTPTEKPPDEPKDEPPAPPEEEPPPPSEEELPPPSDEPEQTEKPPEEPPEEPPKEPPEDQPETKPEDESPPEGGA